MKTCKLIQDDPFLAKLTKQQKKDIVNTHIDRKLQRWDFLSTLSWESIYYGFAHINVVFLILFTFFNFIIFRWSSNQIAYYSATLFSCIGTILYADHKYGHME